MERTIQTLLNLLLGEQPDYFLGLERRETGTAILREIQRNEKLFILLAEEGVDQRVRSLLAIELSQAYYRLFDEGCSEEDNFAFPNATTLKKRALLWAKKSGLSVSEVEIEMELGIRGSANPEDEDLDEARAVLEKLLVELEKHRTLILEGEVL